ncbi:MAG: copper resistance CopC family protein, partial [Planctomycetota bacterium]|jgi:hypothetical protein
LRRRDARTLELIVQGREFLTPDIQNMCRDPGFPLKVGDTVDCGAFTTTIDEMSEQQEPTQITLRFDRPLDEAFVLMLVWHDDGPQVVPAPAVGSTMTVSVRRPWHAHSP